MKATDIISKLSQVIARHGDVHVGVALPGRKDFAGFYWAVEHVTGEDTGTVVALMSVRDPKECTRWEDVVDILKEV